MPKGIGYGKKAKKDDVGSPRSGVVRSAKTKSMTYTGGAKKRSIGEPTVSKGKKLRRLKEETLTQKYLKGGRTGGITGPMKKREEKAQKIK